MAIPEQDIVVIGGGAGGLTVASGAAQLGLKVTLIEKKALGGDCLYTSCIPSKSLSHVAKIANLIQTAHEYGLNAKLSPVDLSRVNAYIKNTIATIAKQDDPKRFTNLGVNILFGSPYFVDAKTLIINNQKISSNKFVIATGSSPIIPNIDGLKESNYFTNESLLNEINLPKKIVIIGAGPSGLELAQSLTALGSKIVLIDRNPTILPFFDQELAEMLMQNLKRAKVEFYLNSFVQNIISSANRNTLYCMNSMNEKFILESNAIVIAAGRAPNVSSLGLQAAKVEYNSNGIIVDSKMRTSQKHIYAIGDVIQGVYKTTHAAEYHAGIVLSNAVFGLPMKSRLSIIPSVIYTDPEFATIGLSEAEAMQKKISNISTLKFNLQDIDRAVCENCHTGKIKIIIKKDKILGASILGPHAGELISEIALAMRTNATVGDLATTIHAYPTFSQAIKRAVNTHYAQKLFNPTMHRIVKWLKKVFF